VLAHALTEQLASAPAEDSTVHVGVTFKSRAGNYCRTFTVHDTTTTAGLACRDHNEWHVQALAQNAATQESTGPYRQAASPMPRSVLQAVEDTIAGDPLDARAEAAAREKGWNP
jgi:hypothetical protein